MKCGDAATNGFMVLLLTVRLRSLSPQMHRGLHLRPKSVHCLARRCTHCTYKVS